MRIDGERKKRKTCKLWEKWGGGGGGGVVVRDRNMKGDENVDRLREMKRNAENPGGIERERDRERERERERERKKKEREKEKERKKRERERERESCSLSFWNSLIQRQ